LKQRQGNQGTATAKELATSKVGFLDKSQFSSARHQVTVGDLDDDIFQSEVSGLGLVHDQVCQSLKFTARSNPYRFSTLNVSSLRTRETLSVVTRHHLGSLRGIGEDLFVWIEF
jgi:hypothetical protein